jgi:hypothetical protein
MHKLAVFLSSTVDDLGGVRDEIAAALSRFGITVLRSETDDFPVKAGVSSHEACLHAARNADVLVTLIGTRFGGASSTSSDGKSIGFDDDDRFNFMLFVRDGDVLRPEARRNHPAIPVKNRTWKVGEGHAGTAILQPTPVVTRYLPDTSVWTTTDAAQDASDRANYASAVSVPLTGADGSTDRVFIVTSSRKQHFNSGAQPAALTCATVGRILGTLSRLETE